jgi:hypothetical protein
MRYMTVNFSMPTLAQYLGRPFEQVIFASETPNKIAYKYTYTYTDTQTDTQTETRPVKIDNETTQCWRSIISSGDSGTIDLSYYKEKSIHRDQWNERNYQDSIGIDDEAPKRKYILTAKASLRDAGDAKTQPKQAKMLLPHSFKANTNCKKTLKMVCIRSCFEQQPSVIEYLAQCSMYLAELWQHIKKRKSNDYLK